MKLPNKRKLILPEDIIFELMDMTATLGEVAEEYHRKIGHDEEIENVLEVSWKISHKNLKYSFTNRVVGGSAQHRWCTDLQTAEPQTVDPETVNSKTQVSE